MIRSVVAPYQEWKPGENSVHLLIPFPPNVLYCFLLLPCFFSYFWCSILKPHSHLYSSSSPWSLASFLKYWFLIQHLTFFSLSWAPLLKIVSLLLIKKSLFPFSSISNSSSSCVFVLSLYYFFLATLIPTVIPFSICLWKKKAYIFSISTSNLR